MRGLIPARILEELEKQIGRPIHEVVDLVAGTSTGGILSCLLTCPLKHPAAKLKDFYYKDGPKIFRTGLSRKVWTLWNSIHSKFTAGELDACLYSYMMGEFLNQEVFGTLDEEERRRTAAAARKMGKHLGPYLMGDALVPTLIATYDKNTPGPVLIKSYDKYWDQLPMAAAARATASAPTYFPSCDFEYKKQDYALVDGGVFANNPAMCGLADAFKLWGRNEDVMVINLDTGTLKNQRESKKITANGGLASWAPVITEVCMDGSHDTAAYQALQVLGEDRFFHFQVTLDKMYPMEDSSKSTLDNYVASTDAALSSYLYEPLKKVVDLIRVTKR